MKRIRLPGVKQMTPRTRKRVLLVLVSVVTLVLVGGALYYFFVHNRVTLDANESVPAQVTTLTTGQVQKLADADVDANTDFMKAHAKAFALFQEGDYQTSAGEYKKLVDTGRATHEMYAEYAAVLYYGGDKAGGVKAMKTAIDKINSSKLTQADKDSILRVYDNQLKAYEEGV